MKRTDLRVLRTPTDYDAAMAEYETYFGAGEPQPGSALGDRFELLGLLIAKYEEERFPIADADPVEVIRMVMESNGYTRGDLAEVLGSSPRATEILKGVRDLTLDHIRRLHGAWRIPAEALIGESVHGGRAARVAGG